jgi:hypothetical protein
MQRKASALLIFIFSFLSFLSFAQKNNGRISGVIVSDSARQKMSGATVTLVNAKDSSVEKMTASDSKGRFVLNELKSSSYYLIISEVGYNPLMKAVVLTEAKKEADLDTLILTTKSNQLDTVSVVLMKMPVVVKTDTIEFNASSFKVKENDMTEGLLKKLPGIEIARDGSVTANGEKVTQVLVDGKPFFGNDPKMATQNLPAGIVDKVQVIDKRSEQSKITKVEDGQVEKVINITIKKDKKKGTFGRAYAGYGSNERYEAKLSLNHFNNKKKMALVASNNNTGRTDNSNGENEETSYYNNNNGINKVAQARITYSDEWGEKFSLHGNFGYNYNGNVTEQVRNRQTILEDSTNFYYEENQSWRKRSGFNGGIGFEWEPDTITSITFNQSSNLYRSSSEAASLFNSSLSSKRKINEGNRLNRNASKTPSFNGNMTISRQFKKPRRGIFLNINDNINSNLNDNFSISNNYFYPLTEPQYDRLLNQFINSNNRSAAINSSISYNEPLSKKSSLRLSYTYNYSKNNTLRETFDFNNLSSVYDLFNDSLSSDFDNYTKTSSVGINYNYAIKKGNLSVGTTWQNNKTKTVALLKDSVYRQSFSGLVPYLSFNTSGKGKRLNVNYNFSARPPQAYQLQPVIDNSNPLYLRLGNPNLTYSTSHNLSVGLFWFDQKKGWNINANGNINTVVNNISTSTIYDKTTGVQISIPVNVNGVYYSYARIYYSRPVKFLSKGSRWFVNSNLNFSRNVNLLNYEKNTSHSSTKFINTGLSVEVKEVASLSLSCNINSQSVTYSLKEEQNNKTNRYGVDADLRLTPNKTSDINISWGFYKNSGSLAGFNKQVNMVDLDITQYFDKKKTWWLKLKVYDLLQQNVNVYRYSGENFIEDVQTNGLGRFYLLSLNYKLNKFAGNKR